MYAVRTAISNSVEDIKNINNLRKTAQKRYN